MESSGLTVKTLIGKLKKQWAPASAIVVNDIIILSSEEFWVVSEVRKKSNGFYTILSEQGEGSFEVPPAEIFLIVNRGCYGS